MNPLKLSSVALAAVLVLALCLPAPALAWSRFAHEATGHLAEGDLSPVARAAVLELLDGQGLAAVGSWADEVRPDRPETAPLHYVNGPVDVLVPSQADFDLPQGTVYSAVLGYAEILADTAQPRIQRVEALKFLIHFLADLHQPLHSGFAEDRGANNVPVLYQGEVINLHRYWDNQIFAAVQTDFDSREFAAVLRARHGDHERRAWAASSPRDWVIGARKLIFGGLYPRPRRDALKEVPAAEIPPGVEAPVGVLDERYRAIWQPVAERQIARAGARLAAALNHIFESGQSPFAPPPIPFPPAPSPSG
ncbi:S1/P1 nuclease [Wenzhouxiangella limi]|uniref:S1/P1 Nuclease n=1 Tax=Wenzhouxiangella limi TaxID=2707351 RepID=A0A845VI44_9GAMM|nr:S1/P1 nuclease [Wenzhouxiangella limi]NDY96849.1 hypothetical protein [Wenzhouxiangella limi]